MRLRRVGGSPHQAAAPDCIRASLWPEPPDLVLTEKGVPFERREVDLAAKPEWFRAASRLMAFLRARGSALSRRIDAATA